MIETYVYTSIIMFPLPQRPGINIHLYVDIYIVNLDFCQQEIT